VHHVCFPRGHEDQKPNQNRQSHYARQHRKLAACLNTDVGILRTMGFWAVCGSCKFGDVTRLTAPGLSNRGVESVFCRADRSSNGKAVRRNAQIVAPTKKALRRLTACLRPAPLERLDQGTVHEGIVGPIPRVGNFTWEGRVRCCRLAESNGQLWDGNIIGCDSSGTSGCIK
jgi:hypothetical protein